MKSFYLFFFILYTAIALPSHASEQNTVKDFAADFSYFSTKLSPDAKHLAVGLIDKGKRRLAVFDIETFKIVGGVNFNGIEEVGEFHWVNNERLVIKVLHKDKWEEEAKYYGELFSTDIDGKRGKMIYGYRAGETQTGSNLKKNKSVRGWADIISVLPNDKKNILIASTPQSESGARIATIHKLNVKTGKLGRVIAKAPVPYADFIADKEGNVRIAVGTDKTGSTRVYHLAVDSKDWIEVDHDKVGSSFAALSLDDSGENLFILDNSGQDKMGVFKMNLTTGERKKIYVDDEVDITSVTFSSDRNSVYAAKTDADYPTYVMFNSKSEEAKVYKSLLGTFPGHEIYITSKSNDSNLWVVAANSDISAGFYYLYDKRSNKLQRLFKEMPHLSEDAISSSLPIKFIASDGMEVRGYVTYPISVDENQKVPLVTLVHGGPHGVRDYWNFDREVQMLASQGYAVLRVNYRGSGGYGHEFASAGYERWGSDVQQDIIDGTRYVIEQGRIDGEKVCIMGGSFGGYSALQSSIMAPDLFKCAVANAGVYDLEMMYEEGDIPERLYGKSYLEAAIGTNTEVLHASSPAHNVDKLQVPVFIAHGKKDRRVPYKQATNLRKQLDKLEKPYEWFIKKSESHGFYDQNNRAEYYERVTQFLGQHL
jgi:dipeptidyl aminopeptidase/acylaminoacyl peptidase